MSTVGTTDRSPEEDTGDNYAGSPSNPTSSVITSTRSKTDFTSRSAAQHHEPAPAFLSKELGSMRNSRFVGSSSGSWFLKTVCHAIAEASSSLPGANGSGVNLGYIPGEDEPPAEEQARSVLWQTSEVSEIVSAEDWPSSAELVELVNAAYIQTWHRLMPFLQAPLLFESLETVCREKSLGTLLPEFVIIRSVVSISLLDRRQLQHAHLTRPLPSCLVFKTVKECVSSLQPFLHSSSQPILVALLSAQMFLVSIMELRSAARIGGWITRMAFELGLHRCPFRYRKTFNEQEISSRRRLFWAIYSVDRYICQALGLPLGVRDEDIDVCYAGNEIHLTNTVDGTPFLDNREVDDRLIPSICFSKYSRLQGQIMEFSGKSISHRRGDSRNFQEINAQVLRWYNETQNQMDAATHDEYDDGDSENNADNEVESNRAHSTTNANSSNDSPWTPSHKLLFRVLYHQLLILMHRPLLSADPTTPAYSISMQTCISSARAIISSIREHLNRYKQPGGRTQHPLLWHVLLSSTWMSGLIMTYASLKHEVTMKAADRDVKGVLVILKTLAVRLPEKPNACAAAIRSLFKLLCEKKGYGDVSSAAKRESAPKRRRTTSVGEYTESSTSGRHYASTHSSPRESRHGIYSSNPNITSSPPQTLRNPVRGAPATSPAMNSRPFQNMPTPQHVVIEQPSPSVSDSSGVGGDPSMFNVNESQMLLLFDMPSLLDEQNMNFGGTSFATTGLPHDATAGGRQASMDLNAESLFRSLSMDLNDVNFGSFL